MSMRTAQEHFDEPGGGEDEPSDSDSDEELEGDDVDSDDYVNGNNYVFHSPKMSELVIRRCRSVERVLDSIAKRDLFTTSSSLVEPDESSEESSTDEEGVCAQSINSTQRLRRCVTY